MIKEGFILLACALLVGCGGSGEDTSTGGGQGSIVTATATDQSTVNIDLADADIDVIEADAQDDGQINIENGVAEPTVITAIPVEGGIDGSTLGISNTEANACVAAGGTPVNDERGSVCSDGSGGTIPVGEG